MQPLLPESIHLLIARRVADLSDSTFSLFPVKSNGLEHFLSVVAGVRQTSGYNGI